MSGTPQQETRAEDLVRQVLEIRRLVQAEEHEPTDEAVRRNTQNWFKLWQGEKSGWEKLAASVATDFELGSIGPDVEREEFDTLIRAAWNEKLTRIQALEAQLDALKTAGPE